MGPVDPEEAKLLSPDSLRAKYGVDILRNALHGASNMAEAATAISNVFTEGNFENQDKYQSKYYKAYATLTNVGFLLKFSFEIIIMTFHLSLFSL